MNRKTTIKLKKTISKLVFILICAIGLSCSVSAAGEVRLSSTAKTLYKGQTFKLKVLGTKKKVKWKTSNSKIATVSASGKVTAKKKGTVMVTAQMKGEKLKAEITVKNPTIKLDQSSVVINILMW